MYYPDLSSYEYDEPDIRCSVALNVGWLAADGDFTSGSVPGDLLPRLRRLKSVNLTRGLHPCEFCLNVLRATLPPDSNGPTFYGELEKLGALGNGELLVVGNEGECYYAPILISHYIERHSYRPPQRFIDAVLRSTD